MVIKVRFDLKKILSCLILFTFVLSNVNIAGVLAITSTEKNDLYTEIDVMRDVRFQNTFAEDALPVGAGGFSNSTTDNFYITYVTDITCVSGIVTLTPDIFIRNIKTNKDEHAKKDTYSKYVKDFEKGKVGSNCNNLIYKILKQLDEIPITVAVGMPKSVITNRTANQTGKKASDYLAAYKKEIETEKYKSSGNQTKDNKKAGSDFNVGPHIKKLNEAKKDLIDSGSKEADLRLLSATCSQAGAVRTFTIKVLDKSVIVKMPSYKTGSLTSNYYCDKVITDLKLALPLYNPEENKICLIDAEDKTYSLATSCDVSGDKEQPVGLKNQGKKKEEPATEVVEKKVEQPVKTDVTTGTCQYSSTTPVSNGEWAKTGPSWWEYRVSGKPLTGWQFVNWSGGNDWFYFSSKGTMQIGLQNLPYGSTHGTFYLDTTSGAMQTGWKFVESAKSWYFFDKCTGAALTGWQELEYNGAVKWYFFDNGGAMYEDGYTPDGYYVDSSGAWDGKPKDLGNATRDDGDWSCDDESGDCSYYNKNGELLSGWQKIDGEEYFFGNNGVLQNGWIKKGNDWYFYEDNTRIINDFIEDSDGKKYYIKEDGKMARGLVLTNDGNYYCFKEDGTSDYAVMQKDTICKYEQRN